MKPIDLIAVFCLTTLTLAKDEGNHPICIIGAGPSGLTSARELEDRGYDVVVFEKQAEVGGKCQAYYDDDGTFHPLGALLFTNGTYRDTIKIIDEVGVKTAFDLNTKFQWVYNWETGAISPSSHLKLSFEALVAEEVVRYIALWELEFEPHMTTLRYKNGIPQKFTVATSVWLAEHDLLTLQDVMNAGMVAYGYGDLRQTPIVYMLQYFTPDIILAFIGLEKGHVIDLHEVFARYSKTIKGPIHLSSPVTQIDRSGPYPTLTYTNPFSPHPQTQHCTSLILAFPPTISAITSTGLDITSPERDTFDPVVTSNYFSGAVRMSKNTEPVTLYTSEPPTSHVPPAAAGEPVAFIRLFQDSPVVTTWSWAAYRTDTITDTDARDLLISTLSKIESHGTPMSASHPEQTTARQQPLTNSSILSFSNLIPYFPHYDSEALNAGWYSKFNDLQGQRNTYWVSGLNGFETVEFAVRAGVEIVETFFPSPGSDGAVRGGGHDEL